MNGFKFQKENVILSSNFKGLSSTTPLSGKRKFIGLVG